MISSPPKKVALVRGANLNLFEMQTYQHLKEELSLTAFCNLGNNFDLKGFDLPIVKSWGFESVASKTIKRFLNSFLTLILETPQPMWGVVRSLKGYDIIHSADIHYYYTYQAVKAKKKYGSKLVVTQWENIPFKFGKTFFSKKRIEEVVKNIDLFLPVTSRAKEVLILMGVPEEKIRVIPPGIDSRIFTPELKDKNLKKKFDISDNHITILYIGNLLRSKGLFELIYAASRMKKDKELDSKNIKFLLIGAGKDKNKLEKLISQMSLTDQFLLHPYMPYQDIPRIHNLADIFVLPSVPSEQIREQFGMVLIESMSCAKAVVSTLCGSIPEVIGDAGLLVQPFDHLSLYLAIKNLILNQKLRQELGIKARERVLKYFDAEIIARRIKEAYDSL